jgi:hypothetical protein
MIVAALLRLGLLERRNYGLTLGSLPISNRISFINQPGQKTCHDITLLDHAFLYFQYDVHYWLDQVK